MTTSSARGRETEGWREREGEGREGEGENGEGGREVEREREGGR